MNILKLKNAVVFITFIVTLHFIYLPINGYTQTKSDSLGVKKEKNIRLKFETGTEYLTPTKRDRRIQTISQNVYLGVEFFKKIHFSVYVGITLTYAWGYILQWDEHFNDVRHNNSAAGAGPVFLLRLEPLIYHRVSLSGDFSGGIIFYSGSFPYGGDIYNFMLRAGGSVKYRFNRKLAVSLDGKWMHVSNAQGLNPHNPSYEGAGISLGLVRYF